MSPVKNNKNSKRKHKTAEQLTPNRQQHISGGSQKDVSKLDIRRRQLKYRELELHNNILNQINDVVIVVDNEERITYFNRAAERTYDQKAEDAIGQKLIDICQYRWFKPEDEQTAYDSLASNGFWKGKTFMLRRPEKKYL